MALVPNGLKTKGRLNVVESSEWTNSIIYRDGTLCIGTYIMYESVPSNLWSYGFDVINLEIYAGFAHISAEQCAKLIMFYNPSEVKTNTYFLDDLLKLLKTSSLSSLIVPQLRLTSLDLSKSHLKSKQLDTILEIIEFCPSLWKLDLSNNGLKKCELFKFLPKLIPLCDCLELDISNNCIITKDDVKTLGLTTKNDSGDDISILCDGVEIFRSDSEDDEWSNEADSDGSE